MTRAWRLPSANTTVSNGVLERAAVEIFQQRAQRVQRRAVGAAFPCRGDRCFRAAVVSLRELAASPPNFPDASVAPFRVAPRGTLSGSASRFTGSSVSAQSTPASR